MNKKITSLFKYMFIFLIMGFIYITIECLYRGFSHWTMFLLGGFLGASIGLINNVFTFDMPLILQAAIGAYFVTIAEFIAGCILNLHLHLNIWDYSHLPYNFMGQICLSFSVAWFWLSIVAIVLDDWLRYLFFDEERPHYKLV